MKSFDFADIRLLDSLFKTRFDTNRNYLVNLDSDRLLFPFRNEAAFFLLPPADKYYGGWESPTSALRGHFLGHFLSAAARIYATSRDSEIKKKADYIVEELEKCQQRNSNGYIGPIPEKYFDILDYLVDIERTIKDARSVGKELFDLMLEVASGGKTQNELIGYVGACDLWTIIPMT